LSVSKPTNLNIGEENRLETAANGFEKAHVSEKLSDLASHTLLANPVKEDIHEMTKIHTPELSQIDCANSRCRGYATTDRLSLH
jgi:hypothetical protein